MYSVKEVHYKVSPTATTSNQDSSVLFVKRLEYSENKLLTLYSAFTLAWKETNDHHLRERAYKVSGAAGPVNY
ncbi:hypothetical protein ACJIZ3_013365 [Penstemon smallii]|uniref:Uncharacterized protein n=1 Tax=Penstemon smallii TaxID=265156 RepID=A0ABD3USL1_9LAMI